MSKKVTTAIISLAAVITVAVVIWRHRPRPIPLPLAPLPEPEIPEREPVAEAEEPVEETGPKSIRELAAGALNALQRILRHGGPPPVEELEEHEADLAAAQELLARADEAILDPERSEEAKWLSRLFRHVLHRYHDLPIHGFEFNFHPRDLFRQRLKALLGGKLLDTRAGAWLEGILLELHDRDELGVRYLDDADLGPYIPDDVLVERLEKAEQLRSGQDDLSGS